jgi:imidazole glycerol-phosphate synthase subunit HisH
VIAVVDYGASNLGSVLRAFRAVGAPAAATDDPDAVRRAERVVVPGVGHFASAMRRLEETGLGGAVTAAAAAGRPTLGICLGLQLFLEASDEAPGVRGLGLLPGSAARFRTTLPVPHVGWAQVTLTPAGRAHPALAAAVPRGSEFFYHVHSYRPEGGDPAVDLGDAEYDGVFPTVLGRANVLAVQFHPEKSQAAGLAVLRGFADWCP